MALLRKQLWAVIDERTTMICLHAAGQIQDVTEPFDTLAGKFDFPPFHRHCRSHVMPYMVGFVNSQRTLSNNELRRRPLHQRDWRTYRETVPPPDITVDASGATLPTRPLDVAVDDEPDLPDRTPLDEAARTAVRDWRTGSDRPVNAALHGDADWTTESLALARTLDAAMEPMGEPATAYRLVRGADPADYTVGNQIVDRGFASVTGRPSALPAAGEGAVVLQLAIGAGTSAIVVGGSTAEIILARGTVYTVTGLVVVAAGVAYVSAEVSQP